MALSERLQKIVDIPVGGPEKATYDLIENVKRMVDVSTNPYPRLREDQTTKNDMREIIFATHSKKSPKEIFALASKSGDIEYVQKLERLFARKKRLNHRKSEEDQVYDERLILGFKPAVAYKLAEVKFDKTDTRPDIKIIAEICKTVVKELGRGVLVAEAERTIVKPAANYL